MVQRHYRVQVRRKYFQGNRMGTGLSSVDRIFFSDFSGFRRRHWRRARLYGNRQFEHMLNVARAYSLNHSTLPIEEK